MKTALCIMIIACALLTTCMGYSAKGSHVTGQPKMIIKRTPLLCNDRVDLELSLGVVRNGIGSMSTADVYFTVTDKRAIDTLRVAVDSGYLVNVDYDTERTTLCDNNMQVTSVRIIRDKATK